MKHVTFLTHNKELLGRTALSPSTSVSGWLQREWINKPNRQTYLADKYQANKVNTI
jgi:hypothetical protein